jgi:hypothetical protein
MNNIRVRVSNGFLILAIAAKAAEIEICAGFVFLSRSDIRPRIVRYIASLFCEFGEDRMEQIKKSSGYVAAQRF